MLGLLLGAIGLAAGAGTSATTPADPSVADLPLTEVAAAPGRSGATFAVMVSGDGGWADIDRTIAAELAAHGVPVAGWSALRYFAFGKDPDAAGHDLERIMRHYSVTWRADRVVLVGFSRGADTLPFMIRRLPPELRARIGLVALLSPGLEGDFTGRLANWFGRKTPVSALPLQPEVEALADLKLVCAYGAQEADRTVATRLAPGRAILIRTEGGHHFGANGSRHEPYRRLAAAILEAAGLSATVAGR